ncbi:AAA family ATPase [Pseudogemmobacter humi]|uniref:Septum site-determining protein MinD n=1 Tax=Pseudogemmobacter humi TaxID=2483812 RepID=A0A3P5WI83_9RHOB|nr:hypothetical protein [Pseudogemmobacter humi]VDC21155.1 Septum site-determining protein MinD [Pseudogemmobacter humi]
MLNGRESAASEPADGGRICSICDGIDAVLRLSAWIAQLPRQTARTDLTLAEAFDFLKTHHGGAFDQIVIAPDAGKEATPRLVGAIIAEAKRHSPKITVLLPPKSRLRLEPDPGIAVLYGPPFRTAATVPAPSETSSGTEKPARGFSWRRLFPAKQPQTEPAEPAETPATALAAALSGPARTFAIQPLSGGAGGTALAVNLAVELARDMPELSVCLIDLNLQFGNVATYLNLAANSRVLDAYRNIATMDSEAFDLCLQRRDDNLLVFAGPGEILPADGITGADLRRILALAREKADLVILDLPHQILDWSEAAFTGADAVFALCTLDVRSAQNAAKLRDLIRSEAIAPTRLFWLLNHTPRKPGKAWCEARDEFAKSCGPGFLQLLPEAGEEITAACNAGTPLADHAPNNPLRLAIRDLARLLREHAGQRPAAVGGLT